MITFLFYFGVYIIGCITSFNMIKNNNKKLNYQDTMSFSDTVGNSLFSWLSVLWLLWERSGLPAKFEKYCDDFERGNTK